MQFSELAVGQSAERSHRITDADIRMFAQVTGDDNPLHLDEATAARTRFKGRIGHGMLSAGFISAVVGTQLPGFGAVYVAQSLHFRRPVRIGDTITTRAEVVELMPADRRLRMATTCTNQHGKVVTDGEAVILMPEESG
ncbi:MAG: MaoC family dehydratase [Gemmatimonadetes bacterium]|nr:MaoC family dehydratase [Gemmatimonadota bacterium]